jgi:hypothetical protein
MDLSWIVDRVVDPFDPERGVVRVTLAGDTAVEQQKQFSFPVCIVRDITYPVSCPSTRWHYLNSIVKYKATDILIVSYPKCGTGFKF